MGVVLMRLFVVQDVRLMRYRSHVLHKLLEGFVLRYCTSLTLSLLDSLADEAMRFYSRFSLQNSST